MPGPTWHLDQQAVDLKTSYHSVLWLFHEPPLSWWHSLGHWRLVEAVCAGISSLLRSQKLALNTPGKAPPRWTKRENLSSVDWVKFLRWQAQVLYCWSPFSPGHHWPMTKDVQPLPPATAWSCSFWLSLWPRWSTTATSRSKRSQWSVFPASHLALTEGEGGGPWRTKPQDKLGWSTPGVRSSWERGHDIHLWEQCVKHHCLILQIHSPCSANSNQRLVCETGLIRPLPEPPEEAQTSNRVAAKDSFSAS